MPFQRFHCCKSEHYCHNFSLHMIRKVVYHRKGISSLQVWVFHCFAALFPVTCLCVRNLKTSPKIQSFVIKVESFFSAFAICFPLSTNIFHIHWALPSDLGPVVDIVVGKVASAHQSTCCTNLDIVLSSVFLVFGLKLLTLLML